MNWVDDNFSEIKKVAESTTNHGKLLRVDKYPIQNYVILDFILDTGNAAGQNMVTLAANTACDYIKNKTGIEFFLESGFNSDKKASARNMIMGRGHSVIAETAISNSVISPGVVVTVYSNPDPPPPPKLASVADNISPLK